MAKRFLIIVLSLCSSFDCQAKETTKITADIETLQVEETQFNCSNDEESGFCSPWHYCKNGHCTFGEIPHEIITSDGKKIEIIDNNCVTYDKRKGLMEAGFCIYTFAHTDEKHAIYYQLNHNLSGLNVDMCGMFNRSGTLCGECQGDYYPFAYSFNARCVQCSDDKVNWLKFALVAFLPLTIFYFVILFLKINITSSALFGLVYVIQSCSHPEAVKLALVVFSKQQKFLLPTKI